MDDDRINKLTDAIKEIYERIALIEKEQRQIKEDILSGNARERMQKRILQNPKDQLKIKKEKIDDEIKIEI